MRLHFDWKRWLLFFIVSAGLLALTGSFMMSLGILLLLLLADRLLADWWENRRRNKE